MADAIAAALERYVEAGELAGAAALVWRGGEAHVACAGWRDREAQIPMGRDAIFRIASMTKPITSVAAMILMEEGRFSLDEPIARRWAPEFADMRVLVEPNAPLDETTPAERPITFEDLLTHRAGFTYADAVAGPLGPAYRQALGADIDSEVAPQAWVSGLARLPLVDQPGATLHYGHSTDLLGHLLARMEGTSLGEVLARRVLRPLGMKDTSFRVPSQDRARRARDYGFDAAGRLAPRDLGPGGSFQAERPADMAYESGGQGLWSTLDDYLAFARLFVEEGASGGVRLLKPQSMAMMATNHLTPDQRQSAEVIGAPLFAQGHGFGLGVAVVMEPETAMPAVCGGAAGAVGWPGAFGGWWQADPSDGSVAILLAHSMVEYAQLQQGVGLGVYAARAEVQALAATA
jgi:CubicO group peptidase (beta-lactamase class C family)